MPSFREIRIKDLLNFIESDFYKTSNVIPISRKRAISQAKNPNSKENDIALILALDNKQNIIGYIGILPGKVSIDQTPYYWNSCWWVDPKKGKIAAMPLFYKMLKISNQKMMFFELTSLTKSIVEKLNFHTKPVSGIKGFFRFSFAQILPKKRQGFKYIKSILFLLDWILNIFNFIRLRFWKKKLNIELELVKQINSETEIFISKFDKDHLIPINRNEINWIIKYPWIISNPMATDIKLAEKYYFSSISKSFSNELFKVYKNKSLIGVLFFTIRDNEMKLPYSFFNNKNISSIIQAIYHIALKYQVTSFTIFNYDLVEIIKNTKNPFIFTKPIIKHIAYPKNCINLGIENKIIQDGDGDGVFC